eukprot:8649670-Pyramimonas_sp.AAC.1
MGEEEKDEDIEGPGDGGHEDFPEDFGGALMDDVGAVELDHPSSSEGEGAGGDDSENDDEDGDGEGLPPPPPPVRDPTEPVIFRLPGGSITWYPEPRHEFNAVCNRCVGKCVVTRTSSGSTSRRAQGRPLGR